MLLCLLLGASDQLGGPDAERDCQGRDRGEGWSALRSLDAADVVAVDAGLKAKALLGEVALVTQVADGLAEADEERVRSGHDPARCSPIVLCSTAQSCSSIGFGSVNGRTLEAATEMDRARYVDELTTTAEEV